MTASAVIYGPEDLRAIIARSSLPRMTASAVIYGPEDLRAIDSRSFLPKRPVGRLRPRINSEA